MMSSARSGSQRGHEDAAERHDAGQRDAVQQAGDVRARRGHQDAVVGPRPCAAAITRRLVRERRLRVQHALGRAARSRGAQHRGQLFGFGPAVRSTGCADRAARRGRRTTCGRTASIARADLVGAGLMVERRRDRAEAPARAVQRARPRAGWATATRPRRPARRPRRAGRRRRRRPRLRSAAGRRVR